MAFNISMNLKRLILVLMLLAGAVIPPRLLASGRTDVIYLKNGDKLTGEIRFVQGGILQLNSDYGSSRFDIYWDQIARIETTKIITVELSSGERIRGTLETTPSGAMTIQDAAGRKLDFTLPQVAWMHEGTQGFFGHFDGSFDVGYNLTKANSAQQLSVNSNILFNANQYSASAAMGVLLTSQNTANATQRYLGDLSVRRLIGRKWFAYAEFNALHSEELQLDLRTVFGGGVGRYLKRDFRHAFAVGGGAVWNREIYSNPAIPNQNTPEIVVGVQLDSFNLLGNNLNIMNQLLTFKSLSRGSRTRIDFNTEFRWSLPRHFYFKTGFANNFDSTPVNNTPRNDFVLTTGFGWTP